MSNREWMNDIWRHIQDRPLGRIMIPGSHDSGTYTIANPFTSPWGRMQERTIAQQLDDGIRYFDFRPKYVGADRFIIFHGDADGGSIDPMLEDLRQFLATTRREIVILHVQDSRGFESDEAREAFSRRLTNAFLTLLEPAPSTAREFAQLTPAAMIARGHRLIVIHDQPVFSPPGHHYPSNLYWRPVWMETPWAGDQNTPTVDSLELLLDWQSRQIRGKRETPVQRFWVLQGVLPPRGRVLAGSLAAVIGSAAAGGAVWVLAGGAMFGPLGALLGAFIGYIVSSQTYGSLRELVPYVNPPMLSAAVTDGGLTNPPPLNIYILDFYNNIGELFITYCKMFNMGLGYDSARAGGSGGNVFYDDLTGTTGIEKIVVRSGAVIDSIQATYRRENGELVPGARHGGDGGPDETAMNFAEGEYITAATCTYGPWWSMELMCSIEISTNLGRRKRLGVPHDGPTRRDLPAPTGVRGIWGACGNHLDSLGFVVQRSLPTDTAAAMHKLSAATS